MKFICTESVNNNAQVIDLGDVRYVCQVSLNGEALAKRLWPDKWSVEKPGPYYTRQLVFEKESLSAGFSVLLLSDSGMDCF